MIYPIGFIWLFMLGGVVSLFRENTTIGFIVGIPFFLIITAIFLGELRFHLPIRWRNNARWDAFLCRIGSHRCIRLCGSGCCWECIRCHPDDPLVKKYLERAVAGREI